MASPGGSDDDGAASASATAAAVCCMCGDRGLPHELFRCNHCRLRLQHRYCSDLYPRVVPGPVRSCNWCLVVGEDGSGAGGSAAKALAAAGSAAGRRRRRLNDRGDDDDNGDRDRQEKDDRPCGGGGCTRSAFSADPAKPIKKPKKGREKKAVVQRPVVTAAAKKPRELQVAGGGKTRFKVKVRRYKLLAEVIC